MSKTYIFQNDLEEMYGVKPVAELFREPGTNATSVRLQTCCRVGCRKADAYLLKAWTEEQIENLVRTDDAIRSDLCDIIMHEGEKGRPEWRSGTEVTAYEKAATSALKRLKELSEAQQRSVGETQGGGVNPHTRAARTGTQNLIFAPSGGVPKRGF
jgi:hypothetical protein